MQVNKAETIGYEMPKQNQGRNNATSTGKDWYLTMTKIMENYMETEIQKKYNDCREIFYELGQYKPRVVMEGMDSMKETNSEVSENTGFAKEKEDMDYSKLMKEKMDELFAKIKNGETEPKYRIGAEEFTEDEWEKLLDNFDSIEDMIQELLKEKQKKELEAALQEEKVKE